MLKRSMLFLVSLATFTVAVVLAPSADNAGAGPNYKPVAGWPKLPDDLKWGQVTAVATDSADRGYVFHRGKNPVVVFDKTGKHLHSGRRLRQERSRLADRPERPCVDHRPHPPSRHEV